MTDPVIPDPERPVEPDEEPGPVVPDKERPILPVEPPTPLLPDGDRPVPPDEDIPPPRDGAVPTWVTQPAGSA
jgi:hypothetical protein